VHEETQNGTGKRSSRSQKGRGSAAVAAVAADDAAQDWGSNSRQPTARKMLASATEMAIGGWMLEDLYFLYRIDLKSSDMILLPMSDA
jgi:hypothetical protein